MKKAWKVVVPVNSVRVLKGFSPSGEPITHTMNSQSPQIPQTLALVANQGPHATSYMAAELATDLFESRSNSKSPPPKVITVASDEEVELPRKRQVNIPGLHTRKKPLPPAEQRPAEEDCLFLYEVKPPPKECVVFYDRPTKTRTVFGLDEIMKKGTSLDVLDRFVTFAKHVQLKAPLSDEEILRLLLTHQGNPDEVLRSLS